MSNRVVYDLKVEVREDGTVIASHAAVDRTAGAGQLNVNEAVQAKRFIFGDDYEAKIAELVKHLDN